MERPDEATATCFHKVPIPTETTDEERKTIFSRASMSEARVFVIRRGTAKEKEHGKNLLIYL